MLCQWLIAGSGGKPAGVLLAGGFAASSNLLTAIDSVTGQWTYTYDNMNRLLSGTGNTSSVSGVSNNYAGLGAGWTYEAFGNRTGETWAANGNSTATMPTASTASSAAANNQVSATGLNGGLRVTYDAM